MAAANRKPLYYDDDTLRADVNGPWMPEEEYKG
jgi:hypothetical protein